MPDIPNLIAHPVLPIHTVPAAPTSIVLFVGRTPIAPSTAPQLVTSFFAFQASFGELNPAYPLTYALWLFFQNGGQQALIVSSGSGATAPTPDPRLAALTAVKTPFNILVLPPDTLNGDLGIDLMNAALALCVQQRAMLILDAPAAWSTRASKGDVAFTPASLGLTPSTALANCALYLPRLEVQDPVTGGTLTVTSAPAIAAVWAQNDSAHGIWKAPANIALTGITGLAATLSDDQQGTLNPLGINLLRSFPGKGILVWGARTVSADQQWQYIPVRRVVIFLESSLLQGLQWTTFEPNTQPTWIAVTTAVETFLLGLFRQGALMGTTPSQAFTVRCDATTMTASDIANGTLNVLVGIAPLKPAEFVIIPIQLLASAAPVQPPPHITVKPPTALKNGNPQ